MALIFEVLIAVGEVLAAVGGGAAELIGVRLVKDDGPRQGFWMIGRAICLALFATLSLITLGIVAARTLLH